MYAWVDTKIAYVFNTYNKTPTTFYNYLHYVETTTSINHYFISKLLTTASLCGCMTNVDNYEKAYKLGGKRP